MFDFRYLVPRFMAEVKDPGIIMSSAKVQILPLVLLFRTYARP